MLHNNDCVLPTETASSLLDCAVTQGAAPLQNVHQKSTANHQLKLKEKPCSSRHSKSPRAKGEISDWRHSVHTKQCCRPTKQPTCWSRQKSSSQYQYHINNAKWSENPTFYSASSLKTLTASLLSSLTCAVTLGSAWGLPSCVCGPPRPLL